MGGVPPPAGRTNVNQGQLMGVSNVGGGQRTAGPRERHVIRATTHPAYVHAPRKWANTPRAARTHTQSCWK